jgi:hypothetical protein
MRWKTNGTGTSTLVNNSTTSNSVFGYEKIAGYLPSTGTATSSRSATLSTTLVGGGLVPQDVAFVTNSVGNIPLSGTGVWTLTAGLTYQLMCSVSYDAEATNQFTGDTEFAFVDATTNTTLPNQTNGTLITPFFTGRGLSRRGTIVFQYTPSTNQTIKLRVFFQNNTGTLRAQTFVNQLGTSNVSQFLGTLSNEWSISNTYPSGSLVVNNSVLYQANTTILAGTAFTVGTVGATWKVIGQGNTAEYLQAGKSTAQTFVQSNNFITNFDTPTINTLSLSTWNGTTGTFTAGKSATYRMWGSFIVNSVADANGDYYSLSVQKNGTTVAEQLQTVYSTAAIFKSNIVLPVLVQCNVGDVIRFRWFQTMNANRNNTTAAAQNYIVIEEVPTRLPI